MEYFEPHGFVNHAELKRTMRSASACKTYLTGNGFTINSVEVVGGKSCKLGVQSYNGLEIFTKKTGDPAGFCQAWVSWFVDYRLKFPKQNASLLIDRAIKRLKTDKIGFKNFVRSYAEFIVDFMNVHAPRCTVGPYISHACEQDLKKLYLKIMEFLAQKNSVL